MIRLKTAERLLSRSDEMDIRPARPDDAAAACSVLRRSIQELCVQDHGDEEAFLADWLANKTPGNVAQWMTISHVFVAEERSRIIGVAALTGSGHITLNYVAPEARFTGVSKALLRTVEDKAVELGCDACTVQSTKTAERFYRAAGYREQSCLPAGHLGKSVAGPGFGTPWPAA